MTTDGPLILAAGSMLDVPADELVDVAAAAGFDGVGLRLSAEHGSVDPARLRAMAAERGVVVHDTEVYRIGGVETDPGELIDHSVEVGASALLVVSDLADRSATVDVLGVLVDRCGAAGLDVGLEYMSWTTPSTPADAVTMAREAGCVIVVDLLHHARVGAGVAELAAIVDAGVLGWVQLCDAPSQAPTDLVQEARHGRLAPGLGGLPLRPSLALLPAGTTISVEVQSDELRRLPAGERAQLLHDAARRVVPRRS